MTRAWTDREIEVLREQHSLRFTAMLLGRKECEIREKREELRMEPTPYGVVGLCLSEPESEPQDELPDAHEHWIERVRAMRARHERGERLWAKAEEEARLAIEKE